MPEFDSKCFKIFTIYMSFQIFALKLFFNFLGDLREILLLRNTGDEKILSFIKLSWALYSCLRESRGQGKDLVA